MKLIIPSVAPLPAKIITFRDDIDTSTSPHTTHIAHITHITQRVHDVINKIIPKEYQHTDQDRFQYIARNEKLHTNIITDEAYGIRLSTPDDFVNAQSTHLSHLSHTSHPSHLSHHMYTLFDKSLPVYPIMLFSSSYEYDNTRYTRYTRYTNDEYVNLFLLQALLIKHVVIRSVFIDSLALVNKCGPIPALRYSFLQPRGNLNIRFLITFPESDIFQVCSTPGTPPVPKPVTEKYTLFSISSSEQAQQAQQAEHAGFNTGDINSYDTNDTTLTQQMPQIIPYYILFSFTDNDIKFIEPIII